MIRIFVTLVIVAALGHVVNSLPQNPPLDPSWLLGPINYNNRTSAAFGSILANLPSPSGLSGVLPVLSGQTQTTAPSPDRNKRNLGSLLFQNPISSLFPGMFFPTGTGQDSSTTEMPSTY